MWICCLTKQLSSVAHWMFTVRSLLRCLAFCPIVAKRLPGAVFRWLTRSEDVPFFKTVFSLWLKQFVYKQYHVVFCMSWSSFTLYCFALTMHLYVGYVIAVAWHSQHRASPSGLCKLFCQRKRIDVSKLHLHVLRFREGGWMAWWFGKPEDRPLEKELHTLRFQNRKLSIGSTLLACLIWNCTGRLLGKCGDLPFLR